MIVGLGRTSRQELGVGEKQSRRWQRLQTWQSLGEWEGKRLGMAWKSGEAWNSIFGNGRAGYVERLGWLFSE